MVNPVELVEEEAPAKPLPLRSVDGPIEIQQWVFETYLLDFDWAINASQWQWLSGSFLFYQFNRVYHPAGFARKHDRGGAFRRRFSGKSSAPGAKSKTPHVEEESEPDLAFTSRSAALKAE